MARRHLNDNVGHFERREFERVQANVNVQHAVANGNQGQSRLNFLRACAMTSTALRPQRSAAPSPAR